LRPFHGHGEILEQIQVLDQHIVPLRDENLPILGGRIAFRRGHDGEVAAVFVGADIEEILAVIDVVAVFLFARQEDREMVLRMVGAQPAKLGGVLAVDPQQDVLLVARFVDADVV